MNEGLKKYQAKLLWFQAFTGWEPVLDEPGEAEVYLAADVERSRPDDLRAAGWMVAVHNDYRQDGTLYTFWLFTRGDRCVKGEGTTDTEALNQCRLLARLEGNNEEATSRTKMS